MTDLHTHSYYSDGVYSPKDLLKKAKDIGFTTLCLTDHNGINGLDEFLQNAKELNMHVVTGVEIYSYYKNYHLHILGYGFDINNKELNKTLNQLQQDHIPQIKQTIKILQNNNWEIQDKDVLNTKASYIGVVNIANVLKSNSKNWERIKKDFDWHENKILPITEIINKYFFTDYNRIYSETETSVKHAIKLIKNAGGKAVLAHPGQQISWKQDNIVYELKKIGLDGIEAVSSHHSWQQIEHWQKIAKEADLFITSGSDFHGFVPNKWGFLIKGPWDYFKINNFDINVLK